MVKFVRKNMDVYFNATLLSHRSAVQECLRIWVDGAEFSPHYRTFVNGRRRWDGYFRLFDAKQSCFRYGMLGHVMRTLDQLEIEYEVENDFAPLTFFPERLNPMLNQHQREAIEKFCLKPYGTFKIPTRGGKTYTASELLKIGAAYNACKNMLFIVDSQLLFNQALDDISGYLNVPRNKIGFIKEGECKPLKITVATIQSIQAMLDGVQRFNASKHSNTKTKEEKKAKRSVLRAIATKLETYLQEVDFLIVDEVHEYSSDSRHAVLCKINNLKACLSMSATPEKSESKMGNWKLLRFRGDVVYEVPAQTLKERGVLADEKVLLLMIDHSSNRNIEIDAENDKYMDYESKFILSNERRNNVIVNVIEIIRKINIKLLVLFGKHEHANYIQHITGDELMTGKVEIHDRIDRIKAFLKLKAGVLLATNIFNKGITLPEVEVVFIAGGGKEQSRTIQQKGRTLGVTATKKKALIIDFVDVGSTYFNTHSLNRLRVYEESVGKENIIIYDIADKEFYLDIREYISTWKRG